MFEIQNKLKLIDIFPVVLNILLLIRFSNSIVTQDLPNFIFYIAR